MLLIQCPYCDVYCDETELAPGGEAHITREGPGTSEAKFDEYMFMRKNPMGVHFERWRHVYGCGKWFHTARSTMTLEVYGSYSAQTLKPPKSIENAIKKKCPEWKGYEK